MAFNEEFFITRAILILKMTPQQTQTNRKEKEREIESVKSLFIMSTQLKVHFDQPMLFLKEVCDEAHFANKETEA